MKLYEFLRICDNYDKLLDYLIEHRVIRSSIHCPKCNNIMHFHRDQLLFRCYNIQYVRNNHKKRMKKKCDFKLSALHNTWFSQSRLDLQTICLIIFIYVIKVITLSNYVYILFLLKSSNSSFINSSSL